MVGAVCEPRNKDAVSHPGLARAVCNVKNRVTGGCYAAYHFKKFTLPERDALHFADEPIPNDSGTACWYFLNCLDGLSYVDGGSPFEDYQNRPTGRNPPCERQIEVGDYYLH